MHAVLVIKPSTIAILMYLWACVSSSVVALIYYVYPDSLRHVLFLKDVIFYIVLILPFLAVSIKRVLLVPYQLLLVEVLLLIVAFIFSHADIMVKLAVSRQIISVFVLMAVGFCFGMSDRVRLYRGVVYVGLSMVLFGYVENFLGLWSGGFIDNYFNAKSIIILDSGYPIFFIEPIPNALSGYFEVTGIPRMTSLMLDPINFGHSVVLWICLVYFEKNVILNKGFKFIVLVVFIGALIMSFSKGAILQLFLVLFLHNLKVSYSARVLVAIGGVVSLMVIFYPYHAGVVLHVQGLLSALKSISLFGFGLGNAGNYATMFGAGSAGGIADSYHGSLIGQIGLLGYAVWLIGIMFVLTKIDNKNIVKSVFVAQLLIASVSENSFNFLSIVGVAFFIGYEFRKYYEKSFASIVITNNNV